MYPDNFHWVDQFFRPIIHKKKIFNYIYYLIFSYTMITMLMVFPQMVADQVQPLMVKVVAQQFTEMRWGMNTI